MNRPNEPHYMCENFGDRLVVFYAVNDGKKTKLSSSMFQTICDCREYARAGGFTVEESCREVVFENPRETIAVVRWFQKERTS